MTSLSEIVDVVIGVDTHVNTHSAAALDARTGGVLGELTVETTPDGYEELVAFADEHSALRAWAIEGTGGHGAGLARLLHDRSEVVVELDRPQRSKRRNGAKSDPLDAIRAAREALSRAKLGAPRSAGDRQALSVLLAVRRSAVESAGNAQRQVFSLVIAGPRGAARQVPGQKDPGHALRRRPAAHQPGLGCRDSNDRQSPARLARCAFELSAEAARHEKAILAIVRSWRPDLLDQPGVGPIIAATLLCAWSHPGQVR